MALPSLKIFLRSIIFILLVLTGFINSSCREKPEAEHKEKGAICAIGKTKGKSVTKVIGPVGGTLLSQDQKLKVIFPEGALTSNISVSIEIAENTNPAGLGFAYKILPTEIKLLKPFKIIFFYERNKLSGFHETLFPSYQDHDGIWQAISGKLDKNEVSISFQTSISGDWCLFEALKLETSAHIIKPGDSSILTVYQYLPKGTFRNYKEVLLKNKVLPVINKTKAELPIAWALLGEGKLSYNGTSAVLKAPDDLPAENPVEIKASLENIPGVLTTKVFIAWEGISLRIDNMPWLNLTLPTAETLYGIHQITAVFLTDEAVSLTIFWNSSDSVMNWEMDFPQFKLIKNHLQYFQYYASEGKNMASPGYFQIFNPEKTDGYVAGRFYLEKSGIYDTNILEGEPFKNTAKIEGVFCVQNGASHKRNRTRQ